MSDEDKPEAELVEAAPAWVAFATALGENLLSAIVPGDEVRIAEARSIEEQAKAEVVDSNNARDVEMERIKQEDAEKSREHERFKWLVIAGMLIVGAVFAFALVAYSNGDSALALAVLSHALVFTAGFFGGHGWARRQKAQ